MSESPEAAWGASELAMDTSGSCSSTDEESNTCSCCDGDSECFVTNLSPTRLHEQKKHDQTKEISRFRGTSDGTGRRPWRSATMELRMVLPVVVVGVVLAKGGGSSGSRTTRWQVASSSFRRSKKTEQQQQQHMSKSATGTLVPAEDTLEKMPGA